MLIDSVPRVADALWGHDFKEVDFDLRRLSVLVEIDFWAFGSNRPTPLRSKEKFD